MAEADINLLIELFLANIKRPGKPVYLYADNSCNGNDCEDQNKPQCFTFHLTKLAEIITSACALTIH